jgi:hypothetical protein
VTDSVPAGTTRTASGLATTHYVIADGFIGEDYWQVQIASPDVANFCYTPAGAGNGQCSSYESLSPNSGAPADFAGMTDAVVNPGSGKVTATEAVELGAVASDVTYFTVTFTDGQQLKLIPVTVNGRRYVAWGAPQSMTVASVTAYLGGPYSASGPTETAVPYTGNGLASFGLWLKAGQAGPPRAHGVIASGQAAGQSWSVSAYEGPWGTCFETSDGSGACEPQERFTSTAFLGSTGGDGAAGLQFGSAAPDVNFLSVLLSNGKTTGVYTTTVGNEEMFAFWLGKGVTPVSWTAFDADHGHEVGHGKA